MAIDLTFADVCKSLRDECPEIDEDIKNFSNLILAIGVAATAGPVAVAVGGASVTPLAVGITAVSTLANLIGIKNEIPRIATSIINKVASKREDDPLARFKRMERAYYLLCFTAFFEALGQDKQLSKLLKKAKVTRDDKLGLTREAAQELWGTAGQTSGSTSEGNELALLNFKLELPHPAATFEEQTKQLQPLYEYLAYGTENFITKLAVWDEISEQEHITTHEALKKLPGKAYDYFKAQYYLLATKFQEFYIWSDLQEQKETRIQLRALSDFTQKYVELAEASKEAIDTGFNNLAKAIHLLPTQIEQAEVNHALVALERKYKSSLEKPIIDTEGKETIPGLTYPKREQIFIPQKCEVLRYTGKEQQLEQDAAWEKARKIENIGAFLLSYLGSPHSIETPLIILGDPGSGKSLLTSMIAASWASTAFTPIRIPLRNVNADARIQRQIEVQLYQDTSGEEVRWGQLARHLQKRPALLLFDGYDELLQATGKVFSDYLQTVRRFQEDELDQERPTCAIVTSRRTLISKADIPIGATIIRLLDFDEERQKRWIDIWNTANAVYFQQKKIKLFKVPLGNEKILDLAQQPLLLLMLALYDCEGNQLDKTSDLDRTLLYHQLLRRFIVRELTKDSAFSSLPEKEQEDKITREMERLGVAAIGMFNRRTLYIHETQLSADLRFFGKQRDLPVSQGLQLPQGSALIGSFFFVQRSEAGHKSQQTQEEGNDFAYEFLHNTFGEFLAADFILCQVLQEVNALYSMRSSEYLQDAYWQKLNNFNHFSSSWFACLMHAPLFSRPVIVTMLREWLKHKLKGKKTKEQQNFLQDLEAIVCHHIKLLLDKNTLPTIMMERDKHSFADLPLFGYVAIYTLNLLLLRTMFSKDGFIFDEESFSPAMDGTRTWDRLVYLWRSWFSLETLGELAAIFIAERDEKRIRLRIRDKFSTSLRRSHLNLISDVSQAIGDDVVAGLSGILLHDSFRDDEAELENISDKLSSEQIDLRADLVIEKLRHVNEMNGLSDELLNNIRFFPIKLDNLIYLCNELYRISQYIEDEIKIEKLRSFFRRLPHHAPLDYYQIDMHFILVAKEIEDIFLIQSYIDHFLNKYLISKRLPAQLAAELINLLRVTCTWHLRQGLGLEYLNNLQSKSYIPVPLAKAMIELAFELGDQELLVYFNQDYLPTMLNPEKHIKVELAIELTKLARELNNKSVLGYFKNYLIEVLHKQNRVPDILAIEVLKFAHEVDSRQDLADFLEQFLASTITKEIHLPMALTIELIKLAQEFDDQTFLPYLMKYLNKIIELQKYVPWELATEMIKFARKFNANEILFYFEREYLREVLQNERLFPVDHAVELIRLAQQFHYDQAIISQFYHRNIAIERCYIGLLSLDTVVALRRLARELGDDNLAEAIEQRIG